MAPTLPTFQNICKLYVFRVLHIGSIIGLGYKIINDFIKGQISTEYSTLFAVIGVTTMVSGFINTFLLQPKKMGEKRKLWVSWNHIKLLITLILFSPVYKVIPWVSENLADARFCLLMAVIFLSPIARFYREYWVKYNEINVDWKKLDKEQQ